MSRIVRRAWGWYRTILERKHFKVKLLRFHAQKACSYQFHEKRSELWLFLTGHGRFKLNDSLFGTHPESAIHVATGDKHEYMALTPSFILEIQYGQACEEKDIVRI